jgi:hypothetical protein
MDDRNLTAEQLQAIERWENEGGKIRPALRFMADSQIRDMRNEQPGRDKVIVPRKKRGWEKVDVWPRWRLVE